MSHKIRLIKGLSYSGIVHATKATPVVEVEDEAVFRKAIASGFFAVEDEQAGDPAPAAALPVDDTAESVEDEPCLEDMTVAQLKDLAAQKEVDVSACRRKADYIEALNRNSFKGSPTMIELQEAE